ncbi:vacuolar amino acid transporter 5 [Mycena capillaripes]|nr:vacuolar amino acid transporter 5 [Mycena capillaripes]
MAQKYGTAPVSAMDEPTSPHNAGESSALLGGDRDTAVKRAGKREGKASMVSSVSNLANTIIGSGMLTFPLAMASAGIIPGMITCLFSGSVAVFGLYLLSLCAARAPHRRSSFFAVAQMTFPKAAVFFDAAIAAKCFGVSISYLIIIKGLMPNVVTALYGVLSSTTPPAWALSGRNWISLFMIILVPLVFLRHLDSLRHTSYVALFSVAYLVVIVITVYFSPLEGMPDRGEVHLIHFTPNFVSTFPVQVFAFTCSQNLFPIFNELKNNSQKRMNVVIGGAIGSATITYEVIAIFGYLTFGSTVGANIIAMYPSTSLFIAIGQLAIVILVLFSYPLQVHPCRNCLDKIFHAGEVAAKPVVVADDDEDVPEVDDDHAAGEMSALKHTLLTTAIVVSGFTIAFFVNDLQLVLSFVGSTGSTTISFILPGLFYWKLTRTDRNRSNALSLGALALAAYGGFVFVFCLGFNIYKVINPVADGPAHLLTL